MRSQRSQTTVRRRGCVSGGEGCMEQDLGGGKDHWWAFREGCYPDMFELFQIICR